MTEDNTIILSFIVPTYNVEQYISVCLDSLCSQDIPTNNYEIICVNDCSPDKSRDIIIEYSKKFNNIRLVEHTTNCGLGVARNTGILNAKGKYIWFIDSDDYIEKNCLKKITDILQKYNLDVLNFWLNRDFNGNIVSLEKFSDNTEILRGMDWLKNIDKNFDENAFSINKIIKRSFLLDNNIFFPQCRVYEDQLFSLTVVFKATLFMFINENLYFYRQNPNSTLNSGIKKIHYMSSIDRGIDYLNFYKQIKENDQNFAEKVKMSGLWKINFGLKEIKYYSYTDRKEISKKLLPHLELIKNSNFLKGFNRRYINHFWFYNEIYFMISPFYNLFRNSKKRFKKWIKNRIKNLKNI